jgi:predicted nuclease of predicted toxin-antitoxin system
VTLRLLLDENLSERLIPLLSAQFEHPQHVRLLGLGGADELEIWELARREGYLLVTRDEDFLRLSLSRGVPPKVICLGIGNASNARTAGLLLNNLEAIEALTTHPEAGFLLLRPDALSS